MPWIRYSDGSSGYFVGPVPQNPGHHYNYSNELLYDFGWRYPSFIQYADTMKPLIDQLNEGIYGLD